jgi:hypothetical protein
MRKLVLTLMAGSALLAVAGPAEAQRWERRSRGVTIIEQQAPAINTNTLAIILALSAARRAAESRERSVTIRDRSQEYVPLK